MGRGRKGRGAPQRKTYGRDDRRKRQWTTNGAAVDPVARMRQFAHGGAKGLSAKQRLRFQPAGKRKASKGEGAFRNEGHRRRAPSDGADAFDRRQRKNSWSHDDKLNPIGLPPSGEHLCAEGACAQSLRWRRPRGAGPGLANLGNTCFLNATVQCLLALPPLVQLLEEDGAGRKDLLALMAAFAGKFHAKAPSVALAPRSIVSNLRRIGKAFRLGRQEDAHEFLRQLLDSMHRADLCRHGLPPTACGRRAETSTIHRVFGGYLRSQLKCGDCGYCSNTYDAFLDLCLELRRAHDLGEALSDFQAPEVLDSENRWKCAGCNKLVRARKQITVFRAPNVLCVQLKRFSFGFGGGFFGGGKLNRFVSYPELLALPITGGASKTDVVKYVLTGVLVHVGSSAHMGHYYAYVRAADGHWYEKDDSSVRKVGRQEALQQKAYMLFYVRKEKAAAPAPPQEAAKQRPPTPAAPAAKEERQKEEEEQEEKEDAAARALFSKGARDAAAEETRAGAQAAPQAAPSAIASPGGWTSTLFSSLKKQDAANEAAVADVPSTSGEGEEGTAPKSLADWTRAWKDTHAVWAPAEAPQKERKDKSKWALTFQTRDALCFTGLQHRWDRVGLSFWMRVVRRQRRCVPALVPISALPMDQRPVEGARAPPKLRVEAADGPSDGEPAPRGSSEGAADDAREDGSEGASSSSDEDEASSSDEEEASSSDEDEAGSEAEAKEAEAEEAEEERSIDAAIGRESRGAQGDLRRLLQANGHDQGSVYGMRVGGWDSEPSDADARRRELVLHEIRGKERQERQKRRLSAWDASLDRGRTKKTKAKKAAAHGGPAGNAFQRAYERGGGRRRS